MGVLKEKRSILASGRTWPDDDAQRTIRTGWGSYGDTTYSSGSPQAIVADTDTVLVNNAGSKIETYLPPDITTFYDGSVIKGIEGDSLLITVDLVIVPTEVGTTYAEVWFDIGGSVGELYRRPVAFPKGTNQPRYTVMTTGVYTLDTWETNGATVYIRTNGTANVYGTRYVIQRGHAAIDTGG